MKKIKYLTLALALSVGTLVVPTVINAAETKTVPVTQSVESSYEVTLPKSIDMGTATTKNFEFDVAGNIEPGSLISVTADSAVTLTRANDSVTTVQATVALDKTSFDETTVSEGASHSGGSIGNGTGTVTSNPTKAGSYSGVINFNVDYIIKPNHN